MLQKLKSFVTLRDFPESLAYFDVTDIGSAGCNFLIVIVSRCIEYLCFCYGFFSEPNKRSVTVPFGYREVFANGARHDSFDGKIGILQL